MNIASHMQKNVAVVNRIKKHETFPSPKFILLKRRLNGFDHAKRYRIPYANNKRCKSALMGSLVSTFVVCCSLTTVHTAIYARRQKLSTT